MAVQHAFEFLTSVEDPKDDLVSIVFGSDSTLRTWICARLTGDQDVDEVDGETAQWSDVRDDLSTASLFSQGQRRTILIRRGDPFVKRFRAEIEAYVGQPGSAGRLILEMETLASNTRLYKAVDQEFLLVSCKPPSASSGRPTADSTKLSDFLCQYVAPRHRCCLASGAGELLVALIGNDIGMLDTEIARLAVYLPVGDEVTETLVHDVVSGWRGKTTWEIIDAAAAGNAAEALRHLDRLLVSGERVLGLFPQLAWSLRRLGLATAAVDAADAAGRPISLRSALQTSGFRGRPQDLQRAESQLRQLGRQRARSILPWLLDADLKLKGTHSTESRGRSVLEGLFLKLAKQQVSESLAS